MTVIEVGPVGVHRSGHGRAVPDERAQIALECIDDRLALIDDQLVAVDELWATVIADRAGAGTDVIVVHPTWWTPNRITRIRAAAAACGIVQVVSRAEVLGADALGESWAVVEISGDLVSVSRNGVAPQSWTRTGHVGDLVALVVAAVADADDVLIDAPNAVPGAQAMARALADRLPCRHMSPVDALQRITPDEDTPVPAAPQRRHRRGMVGVALTVALCAALAVAARDRADAGGPTAALVEGRVGVQIPAGWQAQRITGDAGSPRLQVFSPADPGTVIHITQSPVGDGDVAETLRHALDRAPAGVFSDFNPVDHIAGRPVLTYREIRAEREVRWAVLVDGPVRIAIGCQSPSGQRFNAACATAVRTAHAVF